MTNMEWIVSIGADPHKDIIIKWWPSGRQELFVKGIKVLTIARTENDTNKFVFWLFATHEDTPVLDKIEKRYIKNIIYPFKKDVVGISKTVNFMTEIAQIHIILRRGRGVAKTTTIDLPEFKIETGMYEGMRPNYTYGLEELGL